MKRYLTLLVLIVSVSIAYSQTQKKGDVIRNITLPSVSNVQVSDGGNISKNAKPGNVNALFTEDFSSTTFPPTGWSADKQAGNWRQAPYNSAGGVSPELWFYYSPLFTDTSRFISPVINTTGATVLNLKFKQALSYYSNSFTVGVATRSNNGPWTIVWSKLATEDILPETHFVSIKNSDVGQSTFQFAFFFQGYSDNINEWAIDDVSLELAPAHDAGVLSISGQNQFAPNTADTVKATIQNSGANTENVNVVAKILDYQGNTVFTNTKTVSNLAVGASADVTFDPYTLTASNSLYKVQVYTSLSGDVNTTNDTASKYVNTYTSTKNIVVVEIATGTWCQYCPGAQMGGDDLYTNGKNVAVVEYHQGASSVPDPFQTGASVFRINYYGASGFPTAYFDGTESFVGGSHTSSTYEYYLPIYESQYAVKTPLALTLTATKTDTRKYSANVNIQKLAPFIASNARVLLAVTESKIPLSWQGQTTVEHAARLLVPDSLGKKIDFSNSTSVNVPLTFTIDTSWNPANIELVAWVQNYDTKEIYNGAKTNLPTTTTPVELTSFAGSYSENGKVNLSWTTATETNNRGYEVQRSADGKEYATIGFVQGKGTTTSVNTYSFTDNLSALNKSVAYYRLKQVDFNGAYDFSKVVTINVTNLPKSFSLSQNYPNPFNPTTVINYSVPKSGLVSIKVYNVTGQEVATLVNGVKTAGSYNVEFNASKLSSGVYFYQMTADGFVQTKKLSILK